MDIILPKYEYHAEVPVKRILYSSSVVYCRVLTYSVSLRPEAYRVPASRRGMM